MTSADPSLRHDSLVATTLRRGFAFLRFEPELEREFRAYYNELTRPRTRLYVLLALCTVLGFAVLDNWMLARPETTVPNLVRFGVQLPIVILMIVLTDRRFYERWYIPAIQVGAPLFGIGSVLLAVEAPESHVPLISARLVLVTFFFYFMLGLHFYAALRTNVIVVVSFAIASAVAGIDVQTAVYDLFVLLCANLFAGAGSYSLEYANRLAFLERRLLTEVATHDGLTGLLNRTAFEDQVRRAWEQAARDELPLTVVMIDIDYFKPYNDLYGHQAGDACLRDVAAAVRRTARRRPLDIVARYGGEELVAVLYGAERSHAESIALEIRDAVAELHIPHAASEARPYVTVSIGATTVTPRRDVSHDAAVRMADRALYAAKAQGRNRYVIADMQTAPPVGDPPEAVVEPRRAG